MTRPGSRSPLAPRRARTLPATVVDDTVAAATVLLDRWHPEDASSSGRSLFLDSTSSPEEAEGFLRATKDLHRAMLFYASGRMVTTTTKDLHSGGHGLIEAQELLDTAMRRLEKELHTLLASLPSVLRFRQEDDASDDDGIKTADDGLIQTCGHLRAIAEAMLATGYGKECVTIFKARRRASVAAALQRLQVLSPSSLQQATINKLPWEQIDARLPSWLAGARAAFASVFAGERELLDRVFAGDENWSVGDAVFSAVADDHATTILTIFEAVVAKAKRAPERLFRVLDVHDALTETIIPVCAAAFGEKPEVTARAVTLAATKVSDAARGMVASFEAAIEKEPAKATVPGGAVHPLTRYVMNYLVFLAEYDNALASIYSAEQFTDTSLPSVGSAGNGGTIGSSSSLGSGNGGTAGSSSSLGFAGNGGTAGSSSSLSLGSAGGGSGTGGSSSTSMQQDLIQRTLGLWSNPIGWLVTVLMRKLEAMAGNYRETAQGFLFLANNTHYMAKKVGENTKLEAVLGEDWAEAHRAKARGYANVYVRRRPVRRPRAALTQ